MKLSQLFKNKMVLLKSPAAKLTTSIALVNGPTLRKGSRGVLTIEWGDGSFQFESDSGVACRVQPNEFQKLDS